MSLNSPDDLEILFIPTAPCCNEWCPVEFDEVELFKKDPDAFAAKFFGLSKADYLEWNELDGEPLCCALTKSGRECKGRVAHWRIEEQRELRRKTYRVDGPDYAASWKTLHRQYPCSLHEPK